MHAAQLAGTSRSPPLASVTPNGCSAIPDLATSRAGRLYRFRQRISDSNTGHVHRGAAGGRAALEKLMHACFQVTPYESYIALAEQ